ncbi:MAG: hypothetical protein JWM27_3626 [Gemmatimonadetes bacterium]|nr:hypothetical protein [Gemmatimonadota bacterium]
MTLSFTDLHVTSFETDSRQATQMAMACTTTLDSLVEAICPDGLTVGCHDTTAAD